MIHRLPLLFLTLGLTFNTYAEYYKEPPQFHFTPDPNAPREEIGRLGPIGLALELRKPNFTMFIKSVEEGSPAAATEKLKPGQMIESINGEVLKDIDPRVQLGNLITKIEATDGVVKLMVKDDPKGKASPVEFKIPVMGAYSDTWPVNCKKSDRIVREMSAYLRAEEQWGWGAALFLLSTGEEEDLEEVRKRFSGKLPSEGNVGHTWSIGYTGIAICEYYLRTGDKSVLPNIKAKCDHLRDTMYNGSWMGRGGANFNYMAGGHLNAAGLHAVTFLLMAKECGVDVDERTLLEGMVHIYRFAGRGNVAYGDHLPEGGMVDNGKVGKLAFAMAAAANLSPDGEKSIYAKARDISATKGFYSTSWMFHGHTGGGIGELWRGAAMGLVRDQRPDQYRSFMDERRWVYELARTHFGGFGWPAGRNVNYTGVNDGNRPTGNYIPLVYTLPREKLRIFGAPPTKHSKTYELPTRPWGNAADEVFYSMEAAEYEPGKKLDITKELLPTHASAPIGRLLGSDDVTDEQLLAYAHHIDHGIRANAVGNIVGKKRHHLVVPLLKSEDPRVRRAALQAITGGFKAPQLSDEDRTDEMIELAGKMVDNPEESWWVTQAALRALGMGSADQVAPHYDRLEYFLKHEEWWLRSAAMEAVRPLVTHPDYYQRILPLVGEKIATNGRAAALKPVPALMAELENASPEAQALARETIGQAYLQFPDTIDTPGKRDMSQGVSYLLDHIAKYLSAVPGGMDTLYTAGKNRFPDKALPHLDLYLARDPETFGPKVREVFKPLMRDQVIWQYMLNNSSNLKRELDAQMPNRATEGLIELYEKIDVTDYSWKPWGPDRYEIPWDYYSYDPPEKLIWEKNKWRYRPVTWPKGAEEWMNPGFDAKKAGWKTGLAPFGHNDGKKVAVREVCNLPFSDSSKTPNTFWEKEVLLMRTTLDVPAMEDGFAYRMLVGGRSYVGSGDGSDVWINGKRRVGHRKTDPSITGVGKRQGAKPWGFVFDDELRKEFTGEPVTVAATGFLKLHKSGVVKNQQSFWMEKMKLPTFGQEEILRALKVTPLKTSAWQESGDEGDMFSFTDTFNPNDKVQGSWKQMGLLNDGETFDPNGKMSHKRHWHDVITFKENGRTAEELVYYSGDYLLDLGRSQALKMTLKTIDETEYLFIEAGDFASGAMVEESLPVCVFKRHPSS
jgi:hypothetical protein